MKFTADKKEENTMKNDTILDYLDGIVNRLENGETVEYGEIKVIWKLASTKYRELLVHIKNNETGVNDDVIEYYDKLNSFVDCIIKHPDKTFPTQVQIVKIPTQTQPQQQQLYEPAPWYTNPVHNYDKITCTTAVHNMSELNPITITK